MYTPILAGIWTPRPLPVCDLLPSIHSPKMTTSAASRQRRKKEMFTDWPKGGTYLFHLPSTDQSLATWSHLGTRETERYTKSVSGPRCPGYNMKGGVTGTDCTRQGTRRGQEWCRGPCRVPSPPGMGLSHSRP